MAQEQLAQTYNNLRNNAQALIDKINAALNDQNDKRKADEASNWVPLNFLKDLM